VGEGRAIRRPHTTLLPHKSLRRVIPFRVKSWEFIFRNSHRNVGNLYLGIPIGIDHKICKGARKNAFPFSVLYRSSEVYRERSGAMACLRCGGLAPLLRSGARPRHVRVRVVSRFSALQRSCKHIKIVANASVFHILLRSGAVTGHAVP